MSRVLLLVIVKCSIGSAGATYSLYTVPHWVTEIGCKQSLPYSVVVLSSVIYARKGLGYGEESIKPAAGSAMFAGARNALGDSLVIAAASSF